MTTPTKARPDYSFDEFLRRRSLITEYQAHRVLARHGPGERCDECGLIVAELGSASETAQL